MVVLAACWQAPPTQNPVLAQVVVTGHSPWGSAVRFGTVAQVPVAALHALHVPQLATLQQTPSVQWPLPHSWSAVHAVPAVSRRAQLPPAPVQ